MRARNLKPGFFKNADLAECPFEARILFQGLWCLADRRGRLEDRPKQIRGEVLPHDNVEIPPLLDLLQKHGLILRYKKGENGYIQIINFEKHQHPHLKEAESTIPAPVKHQTGLVQKRLNASLLTPSSLTPDSLLPMAATAAVVKSATPLSENGKLVQHYKIQQGVLPDDKDWDKKFWGRSAKAAADILTATGSSANAISFMDYHIKELRDKGLEWTIETLAKRAVLWKAKKRSKDETFNRQRISMPQIVAERHERHAPTGGLVPIRALLTPFRGMEDAQEEPYDVASDGGAL